MRNNYYILFLALFYLSCSKDKRKIDKQETVVQESRKSGISVKWEQTKEIFVESDSIKNTRKEKYFSDLKNTYPDYSIVKNWFAKSRSKYINENGEFYKMLKNETNNNNTIVHKDLSSVSANNTVKYLFVTEDAYYIFDLEILENRAVYKGVRRIKKGYASQPVHDLIYDDNISLVKEVYQGKVKQDLFTKNGRLYFEFEKNSGDQKVKNTIDLGTERNF